jgi:hypothetical protein
MVHVPVESRLVYYYTSSYAVLGERIHHEPLKDRRELRLHKLHTNLQLQIGPQSLLSKLWALAFLLLPRSSLVGWCWTSCVSMLAVCMRSLYSMRVKTGVKVVDLHLAVYVFVAPKTRTLSSLDRLEGRRGNVCGMGEDTHLNASISNGSEEAAQG